MADDGAADVWATIDGMLAWHAWCQTAATHIARVELPAAVLAAQRAGVSRAELAARLGRSVPLVDKLLASGRVRVVSWDGSPPCGYVPIPTSCPPPLGS